jgi:glycosyltransferase involved in cell wall biosynthesis
MAGPEKVVAMLVPGGLEHAGGIGRWAGYLQQSWIAQGLKPPLEIIDTRGHGHPGRAAASFSRAFYRIVRLRAQGRLGVVHANLSKRGSTVRKLIVARLAGALGVPLVLHLHGSGYDAFYAGLPKRVQRTVQGMFRRADQVIVLGRFWADWVESTVGVPGERIQVLYNGVPKPAASRVAHEGCHIVLLGRIGPRKGVPELLDALSSDLMRQLEWTATLAGDGELEPYRRLVEKRGLTGRIRFSGWLDQGDAAELIAAADILVLPSHAENFPISVIEALAAGVPVVTTPVGATPELLTDGESALFVPVGDAGALAAALARLADDKAARARIAAAGHQVFLERLDIDALARRLSGIHLACMRS